MRKLSKNVRLVLVVCLMVICSIVTAIIYEEYALQKFKKIAYINIGSANGIVHLVSKKNPPEFQSFKDLIFKKAFDNLKVLQFEPNNIIIFESNDAINQEFMQSYSKSSYEQNYFSKGSVGIIKNKNGKDYNLFITLHDISAMDGQYPILAQFTYGLDEIEKKVSRSPQDNQINFILQSDVVERYKQIH